MMRWTADDRFGRINRETIKKDAVAGVTVGVVAIPLALAFAIASGVPPIFGLYTAVFAGILVSLFGGSRFQIAGPTGAFIPVVSAIVLAHGYEALLVTTILAGIMLMLMSVFRLGQLIRFMPTSVTIGFTAGIAVVIFFDQIDEAFGIAYEKQPHFHQNVVSLIAQLETVNGYALATAAIGFLTLFILPRLPLRLPLLLTALIVPTLCSTYLFPGQVATIGSSYGNLPTGFPQFRLPTADWAMITSLIKPAFAIAFLGAIESLLSGTVADGMSGSRMKPDRELFGQGLANVVAPFFGGMPSTGAIARTATNIQAGALSPLSGVIHSLTVLAAVLFLSPLASYIPLAAMAPLLMRVAWNMSERHHVWRIFKTRSLEAVVLASTLALTVFYDLTIAVEIGIVLSVFVFTKQMAKETRVRQLTSRYDVRDGRIAVFAIEGPLFFAAVEAFEQVLKHDLHQKPQLTILNLHRCPVIDLTALEQLERLVKDLQKDGQTVMLSSLSTTVADRIRNTEVERLIGPAAIHETTQHAIEVAEGLLLKRA
ncbi:SulP family inorganic anion transporter [Exiguobacterium flavidum]|uniref:SulP family inorganic anion transporter n=1 Tax=Exiguobacterium flavidum TaxID=2184695 RepID=UPI001E4DDEA3|nr:SulP family inorganic anion transporter [Exiguobacterium flavidum]